jgi:hypothetical protein
MGVASARQRFGERRIIKMPRNFHASPTLRTEQPEIAKDKKLGRDLMITCCIRYPRDPQAMEPFEVYAKSCPPIITRCGDKLPGFVLPKEGASNFALAENLAAAKLAEDNEAKVNVAHAMSACTLVEERSFLRRP